MNNILQDLSPARVAEAIDATKIAFGPLLSTLPRAALHTEPGLRWFETGVPDELFNGVVQTQLEQEALPAAIERVLAHFQQRRLPFHCHVGPSSQPPHVVDLLASHALLPVQHVPAISF